VTLAQEQRLTNSILTKAAFCTVALVTCGLMLLALSWGPALAYKLYSPVGRSECSAIRPGMTKQQVMTYVHSRTPPYLEDSFVADRLIFSHPGTVCVVNFDSQSKLVSSTQVNATVWAQEFLEGGYE
jgi:hypothetical protein